VERTWLLELELKKLGVDGVGKEGVGSGGWGWGLGLDLAGADLGDGAVEDEEE
jgi:hypothetical protein